LLKDSDYLIKEYDKIKIKEPNNTKTLSQIKLMLRDNERKLIKLKK